MEDTLLRIPVVCPECAKEFLIEFPVGLIAEALAKGDPIRLASTCHERVWQANSLEREQLGEYLQAVSLSRAARLPANASIS